MRCRARLRPLREKARALLDEAARRGESEGPEQGSLIFVGSNPRWMRS